MDSPDGMAVYMQSALFFLLWWISGMTCCHIEVSQQGHVVMYHVALVHLIRIKFVCHPRSTMRSLEMSIA